MSGDFSRSKYEKPKRFGMYLILIRNVLVVKKNGSLQVDWEVRVNLIYGLAGMIHSGNSFLGLLTVRETG